MLNIAYIARAVAYPKGRMLRSKEKLHYFFFISLTWNERLTVLNGKDVDYSHFPIPYFTYLSFFPVLDSVNG